jgi:hypothetical protein
LRGSPRSGGSVFFRRRSKVKATIETLPPDSINDVFERLKNGKVNGPVVLGIGEKASRNQSPQPPEKNCGIEHEGRDQQWLLSV